MKKLENVTEETLDKVMEFDHVIRVHADGTVSDGYHDRFNSPELVMDVDEDGQDVSGDDELRRQAKAYGWELITGFSGQQSYSGPVMNSSEYVGGGLARHILETPGYWVITSVECTGPDPDAYEEPAGWAIAYREE